MKHLIWFIAYILLDVNSPSQPVPLATIAYIRDGKEIRLIRTDGSNDRRLWTHPDATKDLGLNGLAWRPDGKELAFSSSHDAVHSIYHADLYAIGADSTGFRKITNSPDRSQFIKYPKGSVTVVVRNNQYSFQAAQSSAGVFFIYIAGADEAQQITLPPGSVKTITFKNVADFGKKAQAIVAMYGKYRWIMPGTDVQSGKLIKAPDFIISGDGIDLLGAFHPVWKSDGSQISYRSGLCTVSSIPTFPPVGEYYYHAMFGGKAPMGSCTWDWGPIPSLADQIIYTENSGEHSSIYQMKEGGVHPGKYLTDFSDIQYQILSDLHWMPDGSGLLYSTVDLFRQSSNIFRFDFKSKQTTQVTKLDNSFARKFSISPDGQWIVYERSSTYDDDETTKKDIWIQKMDGSNSKLLVKNGESPAWGKN
jgi:hypothetical protein